VTTVLEQEEETQRSEVAQVTSARWWEWLGPWHGIVPGLHESPFVLKWLERRIGRVLAVLAACGLLAFTTVPHVPVIGAVLLAIALFPAHRRALCLAAGAWWLFRYHEWLNLDVIDGIVARENDATVAMARMPATLAGILVAALAWIALVIGAVRRWAPSGSSKPPASWWVLLVQLVVTVAVILLPLTGAWRLVLWGILAISAKYVIHAALAVQDPPADRNYQGWRQVIAWYPFWFFPMMQNHTPIPKGAAYLSRIEARTPAAFAVSQARGMRLLIWGVLLSLPVIQHAGQSLQALGGLTLLEAFAEVSRGRVVEWYVAWAALSGAFLEEILRTVAGGHLAIAIARLAGFYAPRNTYNLLKAQTIADFWNRFLYYYKELLVDLFFVPTYRRYFKTRPVLRLIVATTAAAGVGNFLVHVLYWAPATGVLEGWPYTIGFYGVFAFYTLLLTIGIVVSQLRARTRPPAISRPWYRQLGAILGVWMFFCVIRVFGALPSGDLAAHFRFLLALLPV
jgi:hypothetical protein